MHRLAMLLLCILFPVLWLTVVQGQCPSGSASIWDNIVSKRNTLLNFFFKNRRLSVWKDNVTQTERDQFFVTSVPRLVPASLDCQRSFLKDGTKLLFYVEMWSHAIQNAAIQAIHEHLGVRPTRFQVQPLPFQKIRLAHLSGHGAVNPAVVLDSSWLPNTQEPFGHKFFFWIQNQETCRNIKEEILKNPEGFVVELKLEGLLSAESHSTRSISVSSRHITSSRLFASLRAMNSPGNVRFLQSKDVNRLGQEIAFQVLATEISDVDYVPAEDELSLKQLITSHLSTEKTNSARFRSRNQWDSVFWEPTFARPDKITQFLQKAIHLDQGNRRFSWNGTKAEEWARANNIHLKSMGDFFKRNDYSSADEGDGSLGFSFLGFEFGGSLKGGGQESSTDIRQDKEGHSKVNQTTDQGGKLRHLSEDQLRSWLRNQDVQMEVRGEIFRPKPVALWRLNLHDLEQTGSLLTKRVQVRRVQIETSFQVGVKDPNEKEVTSEEGEALRKMLEVLNERMETTEKRQNLSEAVGAEMAEQQKELTAELKLYDQNATTGLSQLNKTFNSEISKLKEKTSRTDTELLEHIMSTSCRRDIPKTAKVHGIEYGSEEPWIPNGANATIFCTAQCKKRIDKVTAECLRGLWKYQPCNQDCSILLIGGSSGSSQTSLEWFNPWTPTQNRLLATQLPTGKYAHISAVLEDGRILIAGGSDAISFLFDPVRETLMRGPDMNTKRQHAGAAVVNGVVYVCGGNDGQNLRTCERFQWGAWHSSPSMSAARRALAMVALDRTLYCLGGHDGQSLSLMEAFNVETDRWTAKAPMPTARHALSAAVWDKTIIACGGNNGRHLSLCEKYDVEADRWSSMAPMKKPRYGFSLVSVGDWLVALGGSSDGISDTAEISDPNKDQWEILSHPKLANKRPWHSAVVI